MEAITILDASITVTRRDDGMLISPETDLLSNLGIIEQLHSFTIPSDTTYVTNKNVPRHTSRSMAQCQNLSIRLARGIAATVEKVSFMLVKDDPADRSSQIIRQSLLR